MRNHYQEQHTVDRVAVNPKLEYVVVNFKDSDKSVMLLREKYKRFKNRFGLSLLFPNAKVTVNYCRCVASICPLSLTIEESTVNCFHCCVYDVD